MPHAAGLWYEWHGPEDGEVVILSPGLGGSAHYWSPNVAAFAERYRVLLYDHRGTGRSEREIPDELSVEDMARDLLALMDALEIGSAHLVGHAAGGLIGLALASMSPDRIRKLVVVNGWAKLDPYTARCFDVRLSLLRDSGPEAYLRAQPIFLYEPGWISVFSKRLDEEAERQLADFPAVETVEKRIEALRAFDLAALPGPIENPVLVLAAGMDALVPSHCARPLTEGLPNATRKAQFDGAHACNVSDPEEFHERVLPWLAGETLTEE